MFSEHLIEKVYVSTKAELPSAMVDKEVLEKEISFFEMTMKQIENHPWVNVEKNVKKDTSSVLYKEIQEKFVGPDPEEDYKQVIIWKIAELLYITASVDHDPSIPVKWDVVVFDENKQMN